MIMDDREIVITDCAKVAKIVMKQDWHWTPQRIKKAVVISRNVDLDRLKTLPEGKIYITGYPDCFDKIFKIIEEGYFEIGNPFAGSTIDPSFFINQSQILEQENEELL
jgi:hypothetical protein